MYVVVLGTSYSLLLCLLWNPLMCGRSDGTDPHSRGHSGESKYLEDMHDLIEKQFNSHTSNDLVTCLHSHACRSLDYVLIIAHH